MAFNPTTELYCDTETTGTAYWHGHQPFAVPMCDQDGEMEWVEWEVDPLTRRVRPEKRSLRLLKELMGDPSTDKIFFNAKFDVGQLLHGVGVETRGRIHDGFIAARVCNT